eukprot:CAMPEP_0113890886 /NCGR_PEP_ID=MMETSP0780_2-20120614/14421_1 /TAXON_ID=652834 /ORGANISM="Palpitomonas bilix" /LENGTH=279 /DNA_ID=CAMNT_0000880385 /DNA_START=121 /DNA_END=960 /DNA_ORIENTATION=- /assembly_acc=CAM_ASM_000599
MAAFSLSISDIPLSPSALKRALSPSLLQRDPVEVARQLTLLDHSLFSSIHPRELLSQRWVKAEKERASPNVLAMITRFNVVSKWVSSEVVRVGEVGKRAAVVKKFIAIAKECRALNNFNGTLSITTGLSASPVHRLKKTWQELGKAKKDYDELQQLLSREGNFKALRNALRQASQPCCPYLGMFLTDLTFIEEGNPSVVDGRGRGVVGGGSEDVVEHVNFFKLDLLAGVLEGIRQYQSTPYRLKPLLKMQALLLPLHHRIMEEEEMFKLSMQAEPRQQQ